MPRREYAVALNINEKQIIKVIIDPHYEEKHGETISDTLILELVKLLNGRTFIPAGIINAYRRENK